MDFVRVILVLVIFVEVMIKRVYYKYKFVGINIVYEVKGENIYFF